MGAPFTIFTKLHHMSSSGTVKVFYLYRLIPIKGLRRPDMTDKLSTGMLNLNTNKQIKSSYLLTKHVQLLLF